MGPLHLVPQDVLLIAASMLLTRIDDVRVLSIPTLFLSSYCLALGVSCWVTGQKLWAYGLAAALGLVILFVQRPTAALLASLLATVFTPLAIRHSLQAFPWTLPWFANGRSWQQLVDDYKESQ